MNADFGISRSNRSIAVVESLGRQEKLGCSAFFWNQAYHFRAACLNVAIPSAASRVATYGPVGGVAYTFPDLRKQHIDSSEVFEYLHAVGITSKLHHAFKKLFIEVEQSRLPVESR